jgi:hypothetical protein
MFRACDRHRQAAELRCSEGRSAAQHRALREEVSKQPSLEFTSANQVARAGDEALQVPGPRAAFYLGLRAELVTFPSAASP